MQRQSIPFNELTSHRLLLASITLAIKFLEDDAFSDEFYAVVGGVKVKETIARRYSDKFSLFFVYFFGPGPNFI